MKNIKIFLKKEKKNGEKGQSYKVIAFGIFLDTQQLMRSLPTETCILSMGHITAIFKYGSNYYHK